MTSSNGYIVSVFFAWHRNKMLLPDPQGEYLKSVMAAIERLQFAENWSVPHGHTVTSFISTDGLRATADSTVESLAAVEDQPDKPAAARAESEVRLCSCWVAAA
jgi:hypothetical protein